MKGILDKILNYYLVCRCLVVVWFDVLLLVLQFGCVDPYV